MPADQIAKLRALLDAATPGPWDLREVGQSDETGEEWSYTDIVAPSGHRVRCGCDDDQDRCDAEMIAALRNAAPELLAVAEALRSAVDAYDRGETYDDLPAIWDELMAGSKALRALDAKLREVLR